MTAYDDTMPTRSQFQTPPAYPPRSSSDRDRFDYGLYNRPASGGAGGPPTYSHGIYDNRRYTPYSSSYASESEYSPATQSAPASSFGVMGDPLDSRGKRRRGNLPKPVTDILRAWFHEHLDHPYPTEEDKQMFMSRTGLSISQVNQASSTNTSRNIDVSIQISNWFINARRRQLPALRNQLRNQNGETNQRTSTPGSDGEHSPTAASTPPMQPQR